MASRYPIGACPPSTNAVAKAVVEIPETIFRSLRGSMMASNLSHEVLAFVLCRRGWRDGRMVFQPVITFVPGERDYRVQTEASCMITGHVWAKILAQVRTRRLHLLDLHTHPTHPADHLDFSPADRISYADMREDLLAIPNQPTHLSAVYHHAMRADHWRYMGETFDGRRLDIAVRYPRAAPFLGPDFAEVGQEVGAWHHCPSPAIVPSAWQSLPEYASEWRAVIVGSDAGSMVWADTSPYAITLQITHWPRQCQCAQARRFGDVVQLAQLGYITKHPWLP